MTGDETGGQYIHTSQARTMLMQKLMQGRDMDGMEGLIKTQKEEEQSLARKDPVEVIERSLEPTQYLLATNMFDPKEVDLQQDPSYFMDIKDQVEEACQAWGQIERIYVEQNSPGNVWIKFGGAQADAIQSAVTTVQELNRKNFDGRLLTAHFVKRDVF